MLRDSVMRTVGYIGAGKTHAFVVPIDGQQRLSSIQGLTEVALPIQEPASPQMLLTPEPYAPRRLRSRANDRQNISQFAQVDDLPLEGNESEVMLVNPTQELYEADRKEARLVKAFADYLTSNGHHSGRQRILPPGESRPLFTDLHAKGLGLLVEAKGSVTRENIRMAIGQLADYGRFVGHTIRAILLPFEPREDLLTLAETQDCAVIWPEGKGFVSTNPKALP